MERFSTSDGTVITIEERHDGWHIVGTRPDGTRVVKAKSFATRADARAELIANSVRK